MAQSNKYFSRLSKYRLLVCKNCKYVICLNQDQADLRDKHHGLCLKENRPWTFIRRPSTQQGGILDRIGSYKLCQSADTSIHVLAEEGNAPGLIRCRRVAADLSPPTQPRSCLPRLGQSHYHYQASCRVFASHAPRTSSANLLDKSTPQISLCKGRQQPSTPRHHLPPCHQRIPFCQ